MNWWPLSPPCAVPPPAPDAPAWADPRLILAAASYRVQAVAVSLTATVTVAVNDPLRVAIGFSIDGTAPANCRFYVDAAQVSRGWYSGGAISPLWFDLFTFGPLVTTEWFARASGPGTVVVTQLYRLQ